MTIRKQLRTAFILFFTAIVLLLLCNLSAIQILGAVQEFIKGEGFWSKAQKNAILNLQEYLITSQERSYESFQAYLEIIDADSRARRELSKESPDFSVSDAGFIEGGLDPRDVRTMSYLFYYARAVPVIARASKIWAEGDLQIADLQTLGSEIHERLSSGSFALTEREGYFKRLMIANDDLTNLERRFSVALSDGARLIRELVIGFNL